MTYLLKTLGAFMFMDMLFIETFKFHLFEKNQTYGVDSLKLLF